MVAMRDSERRFPWELLIACPALAIAIVCALFVAVNTGPTYDFIIVNDRVVGGTFDKIVAIALASVFGAIGIALVRFSRRK